MNGFVKACTIYLTGETITVVCNHKTVFGTYELGEPIVQGKVGDSPDVIGETILKVLYSCREGAPLEEFIANPIVPKILRAVGFSSWSKFEKKKKECHVELRDSIATITPYKRGESRGVTLPALSEPMKCNVSSREIGAEVLRVMNEINEGATL